MRSSADVKGIRLSNIEMFVIICIVFINCAPKSFGKPLAEAISIPFSEFDKIIQEIIDVRPKIILEGYRFDNLSASRLRKIAVFSQIDTEMRKIQIDLSWINDVVDQISDEPSERKRKWYLENLMDTLSGLRKDFADTTSFAGATKEEMKNALDRASKGFAPVSKKIQKGCYGSESLSNERCEQYSEAIDGEIISVKSASGEISGGSQGNYSGGGQGDFSGGFGSSGGSGSTNGTGGSSGSSQNFASRNSQQNSGGIPGEQRKVPQNTSNTNSYRSSTSQSSRPSQPPPPEPKRERLKPPPSPASKSDSDFLKTIGKVLYWFIVAITIGAFLVMLYMIIKSITKNVSLKDKNILLGNAPLPEQVAEAENLYSKAVKAAAQGNFEEAIRILTLASLLLLEEKDVIGFRDYLTNGEYLRELIQQRNLHDAFKKPLRLFDQMVYGYQKPGKPEFEIFKRLYENLLNYQKAG